MVKLPVVFLDSWSLAGHLSAVTGCFLYSQHLPSSPLCCFCLWSVPFPPSLHARVPVTVGSIFYLEVDWSWEVLLTPQMASNTTLAQFMQLLDKPCCKAEPELLIWWQPLRHKGKRSVLLTSVAATGQAEGKAWPDEGRSVLQTVSSCLCAWV